MAQFSDHQLRSVATAMYNRGPANNPAHTPASIAQLPPRSHPAVQAVLASPLHRQMALTGPASVPASMGGGSDGTGSGDPGAGVAGASTATSSLGYGPAHMRRTPNTRHQLCGFTAVSCPTGVATGVSATPYRPFRASRFVIGALFIGLGGASTIGNIQVGSSPQFANLNAEPVGIFAAGLNGGFSDFDEASPAIAVGAQVTSATTATFYGTLIGSTRRAKDNRRPTSSKVQRLPISNTTQNIAAAANVTVTPTMPFWGRQIILDGASADQLGLTATGSTGSGSFLINGLFVGSDPQLMNLPSATAPIPGNTFNGLYDLFLDFDMADTAVPYLFQITNAGTATVAFGGVILGDVDKRRLSSYGYNESVGS